MLGLRALMPQASGKKLVRLAFVLALIAAACSEPPTPSVDVGTGVRFLPAVADSMNDAGRFSSVVTNEAGLPVVAYFGFEEVPEEGEVVAPRPVGAPSLPGVFMATVSEEGFWTRGAIAIAEEIPNVDVAFNPAFEPSVSRLSPENVTGLDLVADGDTYHAVWGSAGGVFYATGSLDPATTTAAEATLVSSVPGGLGPSIGVVGGEPWIAFQTSTSANGTVQLAVPDGERWQVDTVADAPGCDTCTTAVIPLGASAAVAYSAGGNGVSVATNDGENAWQSFEVSTAGGQGLDGVAIGSDIGLTYYEDGQVTVATGTPGSVQSNAAGEVAEGSESAEGAGTSIAAASDGAVVVAWHDTEASVPFAIGEPGSFEPVDTAGSTEGGAYPTVAVNADGSASFLSWYDTEEQDLLIGGYGEFEDVPFAAPSPVPTGRAAETSAPPSEECAPVEGGTVTVVAEGVAFTEGDCIEAPAGEPFTIAFDNRDADTDHNVQIFGGPDPEGEPLVEGEIITGPDQIDYDVPALDPGEFAFNCVVHPTMTGTVQAGEAGADGGGGDGGAGGGGAATTVTASGIAFDTETLDLTAGEPTPIHFVNEDEGQQHNIAIYPSEDDLANALFEGELITGPDEIDYTIDPLEAGEYYFQCDVHTTMNGSVNVS